MNRDDFSKNAPGELVPIFEGGSAVHAFVPNFLSDDTHIATSTIKLLTKAENALGRLQGAIGRMVNPYLIARPLLRREAILSSRMEGTHTTAARLVSIEATPELVSEDLNTQEVVNYLKAMNHGVELLKEIPISLRMIRAMHRKLLEGVRGAYETPGCFRQVQNFIGHSEISSARFIPPPAEYLDALLANLEAYLNLEDATCDTPLLVRMAMAHYQFETIHPFRDGNGRVGRLLAPITLLANERMSAPTLYLSGYFESRKGRYVDLMLNASQYGDFTPWINFFLDAVRCSADDSCETVEVLNAFRDDYHARLHQARSSALTLKLVDALFAIPYLTPALAAEQLGVTQATAGQHINRLVAAKIIVEVTGKKRDRQFMAPDLLRALGTDEPELEIP